jgi:hypothetical protein
MGLLTQRYIAEAAGLRASSIAAKEYRALVGGKAWKAFEKLMEKERRSVGKPRKGAGKASVKAKRSREGRGSTPTGCGPPWPASGRRRA